MTGDIEYRGYTIREVFSYENGKADFQVYPSHGEYGTIASYQTLAQVKEDIDATIEEQE